MIINIGIWLYMIVISYVYGSLLLKLIQPILRIKKEVPVAAWLIAITGLVILTTIASFFSIFFKTGLLINLILLAGALLAVFSRSIPLPHWRRPSGGLALILLILAVVIVLENSTHRPANPDTNLYHAQAIHWIESYPAVPGLGNLHSRLAFNSVWLVTNALFSFSFLGIRSFHLAGGFLFLALLLYCWPGFESLLHGKISPAILLKSAFIPLAFSLFGGEISSPGTDLPACLLIWLIVILWVENEEDAQPYRSFFIALFAVFAITIKLSALPVLLMPVIIAGLAVVRRQGWLLTLTVVCSTLVLMPFLIRNIIQSGYLVYPFPSIDLFSLDWKIPVARALDERQTILAWGRFPTLNAAEVMAMPFSQWFPLWLAKQTINRKIMLTLAGLSVLEILPALKSQNLRTQVLPVWLVMAAGTWFWLFSAPDFRFGYGFLMPTILLALTPWLQKVFPSGYVGAAVSGPASHPIITAIRKAIFPRVAALIMLTFLGFTLSKSVELQSLTGRIILPADYDKVPTQPCDLANGTIRCARNYLSCGYDAFPCAPAPRPLVQLRGNNLAEGFRVTP
jgi:hypothetical protein